MENFDPITASAEFASKLPGPSQPAHNVVSQRQFGKPGKEEPEAGKVEGAGEFGAAKKLLPELAEAVL